MKSSSLFGAGEVGVLVGVLSCCATFSKYAEAARRTVGQPYLKLLLISDQDTEEMRNYKNKYNAFIEHVVKLFRDGKIGQGQLQQFCKAAKEYNTDVSNAVDNKQGSIEAASKKFNKATYSYDLEGNLFFVALKNALVFAAVTAVCIAAVSVALILISALASGATLSLLSFVPVIKPTLFFAGGMGLFGFRLPLTRESISAERQELVDKGNALKKLQPAST